MQQNARLAEAIDFANKEVEPGAPNVLPSNFPPIPPRVETAAAGETTPVVVGDSKRQSTILEYWRSVELFNPQQTPRVDPRSRDEPTYECPPNEPGPWEENHNHKRRRPPKDCLWRFIIYGGIFPTQSISDSLQEVFGRNPEVFDERLEGNSSVFSIALTHKGEPLIESFVLSSAAWALGRLTHPGPKAPGWLFGFDATEAHLKAYLENQFVDPADKEPDAPPIGRILSIADLVTISSCIIGYLGLDSENFSPNLIVRCQYVYFKKYKNTDEGDALNSFFVRDLKHVADEVADGQCGQALTDYLQKPDSTLESRLDIRKQDPVSVCEEKLHPARFPGACWPSAGHHPLVFSQQIAVNELFSRLKDNSGLFGINGPPGTGKTTLLRDIVAGVILERAKALAQLACPSEAFVDHKNWETSGFRRRINIFRESLRGFGMVVASANNGAVENVTLELPQEAAIDKIWHDKVDHFKTHASRLCDKPVWGLIAARLGKKSNRSDFLKRFWYGEKDKKNGFSSYLKEKKDFAVNWEEEVQLFHAALENESRIRNARKQTCDSVAKFAQLEKQQRDKVEQSNTLDQQCQILQAAKDKAQTELENCTSALAKARNDRKQHWEFRPTLWMVLLTLGKAYFEWRTVDLEYQRRMMAAEQSTTAAQQAHASTNERWLQVRQTHEKCVLELAQIEQQLALVREKVEQDRQILGKHFIYHSDWKNNASEQELSSPWMDREWKLARTEVFFAALRLHRAFIHANADQIRQNLTALSDVLSNSAPHDANANAVYATWDALFMLIPVVSTTFASVDRLFPFHGKESIGWLFIDEAGQAAPQAAVGAIWRSQRVVVVGDPLQLEPILSLPFTAQNSLLNHFKVHKYWCPGTLSCQRLADQASLLGTWVPTDEESVWVGAPLRVHRRCDELMFSVLDNVAYHGLIIFGTVKRPDLFCRPSFWFDVQGGEASDSHWIPEEGEITRQLLEELTNEGVCPKNIFLISPFRDVVRKLTSLAHQYKELCAGTIHTVQGKEADIVILVLGGNPKKEGAKDWAAVKPNLLNVAVSRAKRRLYVVGNRQEWSKRKYFDTLSTAFNH